VALSLAVTSVLVVTVENMSQVLPLPPTSDAMRYQELVRTVRENAQGRSIFVFSFHIGSAYPLINYSGVRSASRFPQLWILAAAYRDQLESERELRYNRPENMSAGERYLNEAVLADLRANQPQLLLVLRNARDMAMNGYRRLDYIAYFERDARFRKIFAQYERIGYIGEYALYRRVPPDGARTGPPPAAEPGTLDVMRSDRQSLQLRIQDPAFLLRLVVFAAVLAVVAYTGRGRRVSNAV
jgi:hypothetical protein